MKKNVFFTSLGCSKNLIDAEVMMYLLENNAYSITENAKEAEIIIVNTCGFIQSAKEESVNTILELGQNKIYGNCKALIVTGCLAERYHEELSVELPEADAIIGTGDYKEIVEIVESAIHGNKVVLYGNQEAVNIEYLPRKQNPNSNFAYLKISEGCNNRCTYCIIPYLRGKLRSRSIERIVEEAQMLANGGTKELILIAQDTTKYGTDLYGTCKLVELLKELVKIDGIEWIRVLYSYPDSFTDELIAYMAAEPKICKYLDIPIQHCSDAVLKRMGRKTTKMEIVALIDKLRKFVPDISIRTTLIVGFPGETEADFEELVEFVQYAKFDKLGVFEYSREENTPAYQLDGQVEEEVKTMRRNKIMELQQHISYKNNLQKIGKILMVMVEEVSEQGYTGRSQWDSPEIDGVVYFTSKENLKLGQLCKVKITNALEYDLEGEYYYEHSK